MKKNFFKKSENEGLEQKQLKNSPNNDSINGHIFDSEKNYETLSAELALNFIHSTEQAIKRVKQLATSSHL